MNIKEKLLFDKTDLIRCGPINIVLFGDSVTHGAVCGYMDYEGVYWNLLKKKLHAYRDYMPINMINAGIGGVTAKDSLKRLDSQVLKHEPDLVIVCFGLNDVNGELSDYLSALCEIFSRCRAASSEVIFLTPNIWNMRKKQRICRTAEEWITSSIPLSRSQRIWESRSPIAIPNGKSCPKPRIPPSFSQTELTIPSQKCTHFSPICYTILSLVRRCQIRQAILR